MPVRKTLKTSVAKAYLLICLRLWFGIAQAAAEAAGGAKDEGDEQLFAKKLTKEEKKALAAAKKAARQAKKDAEASGAGTRQVPPATGISSVGVVTLRS